MHQKVEFVAAAKNSCAHEFFIFFKKKIPGPFWDSSQFPELGKLAKMPLVRFCQMAKMPLVRFCQMAKMPLELFFHKSHASTKMCKLRVYF
jgi:hypothetical protein